MKFVEYECAKLDLKDKYERKVSDLNKKFKTICAEDPGFDLSNKLETVHADLDTCHGGWDRSKIVKAPM